MKVYRGSAGAARAYVEADRSRVDDYYLAEGTGLATRYVATPQGVAAGGSLDGPGYERWVAGYDTSGGEKGRLRTDGQGVRFVEVIVNGPKTWSLAAVAHPEIAAAYDAAQERAASQVIAWLAAHASTRVGPRGRQVQVPVAQIEAAVVRHYTSRAGDPHRHLHLQVNARVFAEGKWRGLHTVGVRDSLDAINGIGHAAVVTDPEFRNALASHGFDLDPETGEIVQLAGLVGGFSARAAQIGRHLDRFEAQWRTANPGVEPGPGLRRAWDRRAWAQARPDKVVPTDGTELLARWREELVELGYHTPTPPLGQSTDIQAVGVPVVGVRPGELDRDGAVVEVLSRLGARRSGWNAADVRGEVEQLIARTAMITPAAVRIELAEDLTARSMEACVPLLGQAGVPEHIRALTSPEVLAVEADLITRMITRAESVPVPGRLLETALTSAGCGGLDATQRDVVALLAGGAGLVVIEGAAGTGKTTALAATQAALQAGGHRLVVVTPTLQAAQVATEQIGAQAGSAAWLAHQYGYRWDQHGHWTRLQAGQPDPVTGRTYQGPSPGAHLGAGDLLLVDEAGMLDQDTAAALFTIADQTGARIGLVGDRHQLPAVGRGGLLDLATRFTPAQAQASLDVVHRFTDPDYATISLAMRTGDPLPHQLSTAALQPTVGLAGNPAGEPGGEECGEALGPVVSHPRLTPRGEAGGPAAGGVFDALWARGLVRVYPTETERTHALASQAAVAITGAAAEAAAGAGGHQARPEADVVVMASTREQVAGINGAVRDRLVAAGVVDDRQVVVTDAGERVGAGDRIVTRRNDRTLGVANRDRWTVTAIGTDGTLHVTSPGRRRGDRTLPATYVRQEVELAYATTVYGAQGQTTQVGHLLVGEHTGAAAAYVGMTRGRETNIAHLVAETPDEARALWVEVFARDRADLGPGHAAHLAGLEAAKYAPHRDLDRVLVDLRTAWTCEADLTDELTTAQARRHELAQITAIRTTHAPRLDQLEEQTLVAGRRAAATENLVDRLHEQMATEETDLAHTTQARWQSDYPAALAEAQVISDGPGHFGRHRRQVAAARTDLTVWADRWRPVLPGLSGDPDQLAAALMADNTDTVATAINAYASRTVQASHPEQGVFSAVARRAANQHQAVHDQWRQARAAQSHQISQIAQLTFGYAHDGDPAADLAETEQQLPHLIAGLETARGRVGALTREPVILALPSGRVQTEHDTWAAERATEQETRRQQAVAALAGPRITRYPYEAQTHTRPRPGTGIGR